MKGHSDDETTAAVVCAAYGRRMDLELPNGSVVPARTRRRNLRAVCGDEVRASRGSGERDWSVDAIDERRSELARTDQRGRREVLAANVTMLAVVIAPRPQPDWFMVDRFLGGAHLAGIEPLLVRNKCRLGDVDTKQLDVYRDLGYEQQDTDALHGDGIDALARRLTGEVAALVGQSGVGKTSLTNALVPGSALTTGAMNESRDEGRHTTVAARRLVLPDGGALIDSPGVRDYAPHIDSMRDVERAFPEIVRAGEGCRFADCSHRVETRLRGAPRHRCRDHR